MTRDRVLKVVDELGYRPNAVARALRSASSRVLGLIVPDITNPFFAEFALAIERRAAQCGYSLFLGNAMHDDNQQAGYLRAFSEHQVRGVLIIGATADSRGRFLPATKAALATQNTTLVFLDRMPRGTKGLMLRVDNARGAYEATRHLAREHQHKNIACISGPASASSARDRDRGWSKALIEAGIDPSKQLRARAEFDRYAAFDVAGSMLARRRRPTAVFVHSDEQAIGVLHAATAAEVRVPQDLAVVSFDGIRESALTQPPLTTVQQPLELAAKRALDLLLRDGNDSGRVNPKTETLPVRLILRASCGCAPPTATAKGTRRKTGISA